MPTKRGIAASIESGRRLKMSTGGYISKDMARSKVDQVRSLFDIPEKYLAGRQFDIRIRLETVQDLTKNLSIDRVLDLGCGDGSISLPLLPQIKKLTLLDISTKMLELARKRIPFDRVDDVEVINSNFIAANLKSESFDLVLAIGILAHVDSPSAALSEIARVVKPGGSVVVQFTDSFHWWGIPIVVYQQLLKLIRPQPYALNRLSRRQVLRWCQVAGLNIAGTYRYGLPPLGTRIFASQEEMYRMTRYLFGPSGKNRKQWMGNEFIWRLDRE
jgi:ubiquinone/menaquinone biosynthesis C-methylase UbiE